MGTCIGRRNIRYFICFLFYASLHGFITAGIGVANFVLVTLPNYRQVFGSESSSSSEESVIVETTDSSKDVLNVTDDEEEKLSSFLRVYQFINFVTIMYGITFWVMLGAFALTNHQ